jgi:hypothetical protein
LIKGLSNTQQLLFQNQNQRSLEIEKELGGREEKIFNDFFFFASFCLHRGTFEWGSAQRAQRGSAPLLALPSNV